MMSSINKLKTSVKRGVKLLRHVGIVFGLFAVTIIALVYIALLSIFKIPFTIIVFAWELGASYSLNSSFIEAEDDLKDCVIEYVEKGI